MVWVLLGISLIMAGMLVYEKHITRSLRRKQVELLETRREYRKLVKKAEKLAMRLEYEKTCAIKARGQFERLREEVGVLRVANSEITDSLTKVEAQIKRSYSETEYQRMRAASAEHELALYKRAAEDTQRALRERLERAEQRLAIMESEQCAIPLSVPRTAVKNKQRRTERKRRVSVESGEQISVEEYLQKMQM